MKKIFSIMCALLAGVMMFSCSDQYDESVSGLGTTISVSPETLEDVIPGEGLTMEFQVTCDGQWMAVATDWITIEPKIGDGDTTVTVTFAANMDPLAPSELAAPRSGEFTFSANSEASVSFEVEQAGDPLKLVQSLPFEESFAESQGLFTTEDESLADGLTYVWAFDSQYGMKGSAYAGGAKAAVSYLVSPILDMTGVKDAVLTFDHAGNYFGNKEEQCTLWGRVVGGEWQKLEIPTYCDSWTFVSSGEISLAAFADKNMQIGWRYESSADSACTWEIKNVKVAEGSVVAPEPEPEVPADAVTIAEITEAGKYTVANAVVVVTTLKGYLLSDGTGYAYVYVGNAPEYSVGDKMTITGDASYYYDMLQIAPETVEVVGNVEVTHPTAENFDAAAIDAYMTAPTYKYVQATGTLSVGNYTNLVVEGTENTLSVSYYDGDLSALNEKTVTLYGYLGGSNTKNGYATLYLVSYEEYVAPAEPTYITVAEALASSEAFAEGTHIKAIVTSNTEIGNLTSLKNIYVQDATGAIGMRFNANHEYKYGDELDIEVSGLAISVYNDATQLSGIDNAKTTVVSSGNTVESTTITIAQLNTNDYESQYVAIEGVQVVEADLAKTWVMDGAHTSITFENAAGETFVVFSSKYSTFGGETVPQGSGTLKGIASISKGVYQLILTSTDDYAGLTGARLGEEEPEEPSEVTAYTMTLGVTAGEDGKFAPNSNISGLAKSFKEHTWTATDDSGKDTITFTGNVYYRDGDETVWYFNKKNPGTTVSAEGFGKVKKVTLTLLSSRLPDSITCSDKEGNAVASVETSKSSTITWEFANATDGFTLLSANNNADDTTYYNDLKVSTVVIEYEK